MSVLAAAAAGSSPTWAQLVAAVGVGSILSAIVTGVFLMIQTRMTNGREATRLVFEKEQREADHYREEARAATLRKQELDDKWRDERRAAHLKALSLLNEVLGLLVAGTDVPTHTRRSVESSIDDVIVIGSKTSRAAAANCTMAFRRTYIRQLGVRVTSTPDRVSAFETSRSELGEAIDAYKREIWRDLGTDV